MKQLQKYKVNIYCKFNFTIRGLQLNVPEEETRSPDKLSILLFSRKPNQMKTLLACVLVDGTHRYFLASLQSLLTFLATPIQGILALLKHFCQGNIQHKKRNFSENNGNF